MSALCREDPDLPGISIVVPTVFPLVEILSQMTKERNSCGQFPTYEMQANKPDLHTCLYDEVPPNLQKEQEIASEVPISMNITLPPCWVVLHRLTKEQIYQRYPDDFCDKQGSDLDGYNFQRALRKVQRTDNCIYELYKKRRKKYLNRQANILENWEGSEDMSQDEFKNSSRGKRHVKRAKKKYEQDSEWSPYTETISVPHGRRIRRQVRRPIIESSSEDESFDEFYTDVADYDLDYNFSDSTSQNSVPLKSSHDSIVDKNWTAESSVAVNHDSSDIVSGIIKDMDAFQKDSSSLNTPKNIKKPPSQNSVKQKSQRGRKRLKMYHDSETDVTSVVANIIQEMAHTVCKQQKQLENTKQKIHKKCKWCHTQFSANNTNETMCAICCDLGKDKYLSTPAKNCNKSTTKKPTKPEKETFGNKVTKKGNAMMQIFKNMPKHEKQRLLYTDKSNKSQNEKGYNHCKSFNTPKDEPMNVSNQIHESNVLSESFNTNMKKKSKNNEKKIVLREKKQPNKIATFASTPSSKNDSAKELNTKGEAAPQENNKVLLTKHENGLFLLNFPEPGSDFNIGPLNNNNLKRFNGSSATFIEEKSMPSSEDKSQSLTAKDESYQTYLLPPVPTVLVANYTSTADNSGNYRLSSIFYQNEFTQQHSIKKSNNSHSDGKSSSQETLPVSNNNSPLTVASVTSSDISINKIEPFVMNTSLQNSQLPVVSSVVSLHGQVPSEDDSLFVNKHFINSEQLPIRITHVSSENNSMETTDKHISELNQKNLSNKSKLNKIDTSIETKESNSSNSKSDLLKSRNTGNSVSNVQPNTKKNDTAKAPFNKCPEKSETENSIKSAIDFLGAVSVLAVYDLDKNPRQSLHSRMQNEKNNLAKLVTENNSSSEHEEKIVSCQCSLEVLETAQKFLNIYGSFSRLSDHLLRKHKMLQIKKEKIDDEEETNQSSCRFSQQPLSNNLISYEIPNRIPLPSASPIASKTENLESCALKVQASTNHIEKIQSQIAAMNNSQVNMNHFTQYDVPNTGTGHHFTMDQFVTLTPTIGAPAPVTPKNDCIAAEPRETPSRGSGPRTPARPESATSQPDEQAITAQIKKELMEVGNAVSTPQFIYSQNTAVTDVSSQISTAPEMASFNVGHSVPNNNNAVQQQFNANNSSNGVFQNNPPSYNQGCSNLLQLQTIAQRSQGSPSVITAINTNGDRNAELLVRQYIPNAAGLQPNQTVPSINNQRYLLRPPVTNNNAGKTLMVNNSQMVGGQNVNGLLTNVSNQQFYTSNQVYYSNQSPVACIQTNIPSQSALVTQNQGGMNLAALRGIIERKLCRLQMTENEKYGKICFLRLKPL